MTEQVTLGKEARTLIKIIVSDEQVGSAGATELTALVSEIERGEKIYGDELPRDRSLDRDAYRRAVRDLIPFYDALSDHAFNGLMYFVENLGFVDQELGLAIKNAPVLSSYDPKQIYKRAIYISKFRNFLSEEEIDAEENVKRERPWSWIDAMEVHNLGKAQAEIIVQVPKYIAGDLDNFRFRLLSYVDHHPTTFLDGIMDGVRGNIEEERYQMLKSKIEQWRNPPSNPQP